MPTPACLSPRLVRLTALALIAAAAPAPAAAQTPLAPGAWQPFGWFDGIGPADDPADGFTFTLLTPGRLRVVDGGVVGDAFDVDVFDLLLGGAQRLSTDAPDAADAADAGADPGALDGEAAWVAPALSRGELALRAGTYRLAVAVRQTAPGYDYGEGWMRVDSLDPATTVAPEPSSLALTAAGLGAALGAARRRRAAATLVRPHTAGGR